MTASLGTADAVAARPPAPARAWPLRVLGAVVSPRTWRATVHVVTSFVLACTIGVAVIVGLAVTLGLAVTVVLAVPALAITVVLVRVWGTIERYRFEAVLGVSIPSPYVPVAGGPWRWLRARVFSLAIWKEVAYDLAMVPLATIGFAVVVGAWAGSIGLALLPLALPAFPDETAHFWLFDVGRGPAAWGVSAVGLAGLLVAPWCARGWAALEVALATSLLGRNETERLTERVDELETTRAWAVEVAEAERRRIERDLHDGAQQRLVALAMDLGMAKEKMDTDPEAAKALVSEAHVEAKRAIAELRDLARGIHPVALGDRGLPGAALALANRAPMPVTVHADVPRRPTPSIEGIAYFIISESLTNAIKHAGATTVHIDLRQHSGLLSIDVTDDGAGGADPAHGSGLRGLAERAHSVDGTLTVHSPPGGPTTIHAELPCPT